MAGYFFLHSWHNLFGELLRFADREFYSVSIFYDTLILVVFAYIYYHCYRTGGHVHLSLNFTASGISLSMIGLRLTFIVTLKT